MCDRYLLKRNTGKVEIGGLKYPVRVLHYKPGCDRFGFTNFLHWKVRELISEADRMGSKHLTVAMVEPLSRLEGPIIGAAFCRPDDKCDLVEGQLLAKDRLFTLIEHMGGKVCHQ